LGSFVGVIGGSPVASAALDGEAAGRRPGRRIDRLSTVGLPHLGDGQFAGGVSELLCAWFVMVVSPFCSSRASPALSPAMEKAGATFVAASLGLRRMPGVT
jgi:hypothetical protein